MKKYFFLLLSSTGLAPLWAQVVINPQLPPGGLTVKSQLWNISVVNTGNQSVQAQVELSMIDASNNQPVFSATTRVMDFPKGLKQVRAVDAAPVIYNVTGAGYRIDGGAEGFLPVGHFQLCYSVIRVDKESSERIAEECETVVIEPVSPPQLISPSDSEYVDLARPMFNWLPPAPVQLFANLNYEFRLVEIQTLQTGADAIQDNMPLHTQAGLNLNTLQYPASLPALDTGRLYAWQITARSGQSEVARSEIWTFRLQKPGADTSGSLNGPYSRLTRDNSIGYAACYGILRYAYLNETNDRQVSFGIYDISNGEKKQLALDSTLIDLHFGQNLGMLDFRHDAAFSNGHIYLFELVNSRKERWSLKFRYRKNN